MRPTQSLRILAAAGALLAAAACSSGTEPEEPLAATYVLVSVGERRRPW